ncbi:hypothetical protein ACSETY_34675, partial [Pseudomonas aeruginosa]
LLKGRWAQREAVLRRQAKVRDNLAAEPLAVASLALRELGVPLVLLALVGQLSLELLLQGGELPASLGSVVPLAPLAKVVPPLSSGAQASFSSRPH